MQKKQDQTEKRHRPQFDFIAGLTGSMIGVSICHPLEVARTRLNLQNATASKNKYNGFVDALKKIHMEEGARGFYKGYSVTIVSVPTFFGIFFTIYNQNKTYWSEKYNIIGFKNHLLSSVLTGAFCDFITNPLWLVRTRMQTQYLHDQSVTKYTGLGNAFRSIIKEEGFLSLFKGLGASLLGLTHVGIQFTAYERIKQFYQQKKGSSRLGSLEILCSSVVSKVTASLLTYPHVVIRTRLHDNRQNYSLISKEPKVRIIHIVKTIFNQEGVTGFYRGIGADLVRVLPMNAITFLVYETFNQYLGDKF